MEGREKRRGPWRNVRRKRGTCSVWALVDESTLILGLSVFFWCLVRGYVECVARPSPVSRVTLHKAELSSFRRALASLTVDCLGTALKRLWSKESFPVPLIFRG